MSRKTLMLLGGLAVAGVGYVLWSRGYQNILGYGLLLMCPLMHLFMGGHSHGKPAEGEHQDHKQAGAGNAEQAPGKPACH